MRRKGGIPLLAAAAVLALVSVASARTAPTHGCPTFTGPGDSLIHSRDFRVADVSCAVGKKVVEKCYSDGRACRVAHSTWRCHGRGIPGEQRCTSGRKVAEIFWLD